MFISSSVCQVQLSFPFLSFSCCFLVFISTSSPVFTESLFLFLMLPSLSSLFVSGWVDSFHASGERLRHLTPSTPRSPSSFFILISSLTPSLVFHFPHLFPAPILILLWFFWPNFSLMFLNPYKLGPAGKTAGHSVGVCDSSVDFLHFFQHLIISLQIRHATDGFFFYLIYGLNTYIYSLHLFVS